MGIGKGPQFTPSRMDDSSILQIPGRYILLDVLKASAKAALWVQSQDTGPHSLPSRNSLVTKAELSFQFTTTPLRDLREAVASPAHWWELTHLKGVQHSTTKIRPLLDSTKKLRAKTPWHGRKIRQTLLHGLQHLFLLYLNNPEAFHFQNPHHRTIYHHTQAISHGHHQNPRRWWHCQGLKKNEHHFAKWDY